MFTLFVSTLTAVDKKLALIPLLSKALFPTRVGHIHQVSVFMEAVTLSNQACARLFVIEA